VFVNGKELVTITGQPPEEGGMIGVTGVSGSEPYVWEYTNLVIKKAAP
jgi:hypothetical protein